MRPMQAWLALLAALAGGAHAAAPDDAAAYPLGTGDRVRVVVFGHPDLSGEFALGADGTLALPLVGAVPAGGRTPDALEGAIADALAPEYLKHPRVSVEVLTYRPFYVLGEVRSPGSYPYSAGLTAGSAVALAGGYTYRARKSRLYITPAGGGPAQRREADAQAPVQPGDLIEIPERFF